MEIYNSNEEFVNFDVSYFNGYLSSLALLKDYTTSELGFNFYFKKLTEGESLDISINNELIFALKRYTSISLDEILSIQDKKIMSSNWNNDLISILDRWIGTGITNCIDSEYIKWNDSHDLFVKDFITHLQLFFIDDTVEMYEFTSNFKKVLPMQWSKIECDDLIFVSSRGTYLLHFDISD